MKGRRPAPPLPLQNTPEYYLATTGGIMPSFVPFEKSIRKKKKKKSKD